MPSTQIEGLIHERHRALVPVQGPGRVQASGARQDLQALGEVSLATFKRDIAKLRDQLGMPMQFDRDRGAYFLDRSDVRTELPGLWFSPEELVALLTIQRLIEQLQPGLVGLNELN